MTELPVAPRRPGGRGGAVGRPRNPAMDQTILDAAIELLSEVGYARVSVAEVARRAGVSKPAIYRRWSEKSQLVVEAMVTHMRPGQDNDSGSSAEDLFVLIEGLIDLLTGTPLGRVLPGLVAEMAADPVLATSYRELIISPNRRHWCAAVERGIARGELAADTDVDFVVNTLTGPLYFSLLITGEPIQPGYARAAVEPVFARFGAVAGAPTTKNLR